MGMGEEITFRIQTANILQGDPLGVGKMTTTTLVTAVASLLTLWISLVWYFRQLRFKYIQRTCTLALSKRREEKNASSSSSLESSAVDTDGVYGSTWRVHNLLTAVELKFEAWVAMSARGLFLTYGIPSISSVLYKTGGFQKDVKRRYADMELLIREFNENAIDNCIHFNGQPHRARLAVERLNAIHDKYSHLIKYQDMMYVLAVFMTTPALFMESRWGWRSCTYEEKECIYFHWVDVGNMMNLRVEENFKCYDDVLKYKYEFEKKYMKYTKSNEIVSFSTIDYFVDGVVWTPLRGIVRPLIMYIMSVLQEHEYQARSLGLPVVTGQDGRGTVINKLIYIILLVLVDLVLTCKAVFTKYFLLPLPLSWIDRLAGNSAVSGEGTSTCPFAYRPTRNLDFNNRTYTPKSGPEGQGEYIIENMGPKHVHAGVTMKTPSYLGSKEGKVI